MAEHVTIVCRQGFDAVRAALEAHLPHLDPALPDMLRHADTAQIAEQRAHGPALHIFGCRDHGRLLAAEGRHAHAIQYEIGNPFTAESMTRRNLAAALYAPIRVVLLESRAGVTSFSYDLPSAMFGQFGDSEITDIALALDAELSGALLGAAG